MITKSDSEKNDTALDNANLQLNYSNNQDLVL